MMRPSKNVRAPPGVPPTFFMSMSDQHASVPAAAQALQVRLIAVVVGWRWRWFLVFLVLFLLRRWRVVAATAAAKRSRRSCRRHGQRELLERGRRSRRVDRDRFVQRDQLPLGVVLF